MARSSGLLLRALVLAIFAAMAVAGRPQPILQSSAAKGLARALGVTVGTSIGCCTCACTLVYPVDLSTCICAGVFIGCPTFCEGYCNCYDDECDCERNLSYQVCRANSCDLLAASAHAAKGDAAAEVAEKGTASVALK